MNDVRVRDVPFVQATEWSQASLDAGSVLAELIGRRLSTQAAAFVLLPDDGSAIELDDVSRAVDPQHADQVLAAYLQFLASMGAGALVVEDDTAREGDPGLTDAVFLEGRVLRWKEMHTDASQLTRLIRRGASEYPLNAFVCDEGGRAILQQAEVTLSSNDVSGLARSVRSVIHSVFDAESFLVIDLMNRPADQAELDFDQA